MKTPNAYQQQANELERLLEENGDKVEYVKWIINDLRSGNIEAAKANLIIKVINMPNILKLNPILKQLV